MSELDLNELEAAGKRLLDGVAIVSTNETTGSKTIDVLHGGDCGSVLIRCEWVRDGEAEYLAVARNALPTLIGRVRDLAQKFADALVAKSRADDETVRLQCQLAGCLVAAEGGTAEALVVKPGEYGWSLPYEKTLRLRKERDALKALLREAVETHGPGCHENCDFEIRARAVLESE